MSWRLDEIWDSINSIQHEDYIIHLRVEKSMLAIYIYHKVLPVLNSRSFSDTDITTLRDLPGVTKTQTNEMIKECELLVAAHEMGQAGVTIQ
jgi:hypothetical protein